MRTESETVMLDFLLSPLSLGLMQRAFAVTIVAALVCSVLSCWLVLVGWSLMGDAISHAVLPGVVFAYILQIPFAIGALVTALVAVMLIGAVGSHRKIRQDSAMGIVFTTLFALGIVMVSVTPSHIDLNEIIYGNVLGVSVAALTQVCVLAALVTGVLLYKRKDLTLYAFDPSYAAAIGLSTRLLSGILLFSLALTSVVALQVVGVILVVAMLIIPGSTARLLTNKFTTMLCYSVTFALVGSISGLYISYYVDISPGGAVVLTQGVMFAVVFISERIYTKIRTQSQKSSSLAQS